MASYARHAPRTPHASIDATGLTWQSDPLKCTICFEELPTTYLLLPCDHVLCVKHLDDMPLLQHQCPACNKPLVPESIVKHTRPHFRSESELAGFAKSLLPEEALKLAFYSNEFHVKQKNIEVLVEKRKCRKFAKMESKAKQLSERLESDLLYMREQHAKQLQELEDVKSAKREVDHRLLELSSKYKQLQQRQPQQGQLAHSDGLADDMRVVHHDPRDGGGALAHGWLREHREPQPMHGGPQLMARGASPMRRGVAADFPRHSPRAESPHYKRTPYERWNEAGALQRPAENVVPGLLNSAASPVTPHQPTKRTRGQPDPLGSANMNTAGVRPRTYAGAPVTAGPSVLTSPSSGLHRSHAPPAATYLVPHHPAQARSRLIGGNGASFANHRQSAS